MPINYPALATEITSDPRGYGYAADVATGNDTAVATQLNAIRPGITIRRQRVPRQEILEAIDIDDFQANPSQVGNATLAASWFESVTQTDEVRLANPDGSPTRIRLNINRLFKAGSGTITRLDAVAVKNGSRIEELFGEGTSATDRDVAKALRPDS